MLEADERKKNLDAVRMSHALNYEADLLDRLERAEDIADAVTERKRDKARDALDAWQAGIDECHRHARSSERSRITRAANQEEDSQRRLKSVGEKRHNFSNSQFQKNDQLR